MFLQFNRLIQKKQILFVKIINNHLLFCILYIRNIYKNNDRNFVFTPLIYILNVRTCFNRSSKHLLSKKTNIYNNNNKNENHRYKRFIV